MQYCNAISVFFFLEHIRENQRNETLSNMEVFETSKGFEGRSNFPVRLKFQ